MTTIRLRAGFVAALCFLLAPAATTPAWAQKGGTGGGGGAAGGGGGGGGGSGGLPSGVNAFPIALTGTANSPLATGTATLTFNTLGTYRSMSVQVQGLSVPDGSVVDIVFFDDGKLSVLFPGVYYSPTTWALQDAGKSLVRAGAASLTLGNGNPSVPIFGKNGTIHVMVTDAFGNVFELASGSYAALGGP